MYIVCIFLTIIAITNIVKTNYLHENQYIVQIGVNIKIMQSGTSPIICKSSC